MDDLSDADRAMDANVLAVSELMRRKNVIDVQLRFEHQHASFVTKAVVTSRPSINHQPVELTMSISSHLYLHELLVCIARGLADDESEPLSTKAAEQDADDIPF